MTPAEIIKGAGSEGVILTLSDAGTIKAEGSEEARNRWRDLIREHKAGIVELLKGGEEVPAPTAPDPDAHRTWLVHFSGRRPMQVTFVPDATRAEVLKRYSQATGADPYQHPDQAPTAPMTAPEQASIRDWLSRIGETDQMTITEVLTRCEQDQDARAYFLGRVGEHEAQEERAAILEFDAGTHRIDAEATTGCSPIPDQPKPSLPRYTGVDDERRTCGQCLNLQGRVCTVARPGGLVSARVGYAPSPNLPLRCAGYSPGADDPDQRSAAERWPGWSLT